VRNINELNINEGGTAVVREGPSVAVVGDFERQFGVSLPCDYVAFLRQTNGGHPEIDSFVPFGCHNLNRFNVDCFCHLSDCSDSDTLSLWRAARDWRDILGSLCIPFAQDGGGNQIYFDLARGAEVFLCIHDESFKRVYVAESFSSFLDLLEVDENMI
jgi:cell wall assembly regulator SMI1